MLWKFQEWDTVRQCWVDIETVSNRTAADHIFRAKIIHGDIFRLITKEDGVTGWLNIKGEPA